MPSLENIDVQNYTDFAVQGILSYTPKIFGSIILVYVWFKVWNMVWKMIHRVFDDHGMDQTVVTFISSFLKNIIKILVLVAAVWILWVETTSFVAAFAAMWLAIGMALSGTLWNFASGLVILMLKPYKVGDFVEIWEHSWHVKQVEIFNTYLRTQQYKTIIIPNSIAIENSITNYTIEKKKRIDLTIWIWYWDNIDTAREIISKVLKKSSIVIQKEWFTIGIQELWDSSVNFTVRYWVKSTDYFTGGFDVTENIKKEFDLGWVSIPFPQRDIHIFNQK